MRELKRKRVPGLPMLLLGLGLEEGVRTVMIEDQLEEAQRELAAAKLALRDHLLRLRLRATRGPGKADRLWYRVVHYGRGLEGSLRSSFTWPINGPSAKWEAYLEAERVAGAAS